MRIMTIAGTRPEYIRLSRIIKVLDNLLRNDHCLVDTGQNYDKLLRDVFFEELNIHQPNYFLEASGSFSRQLAIIGVRLERIIKQFKPDRFLVLGDTNSSLGAIVAKRMGVEVYHMEAGNRCHNPASPEEVNRRIIDAVSDVHLPYTERSRDNLIAEGVKLSKIYVTGNPIAEVINHYESNWKAYLEDFSLELIANNYFLATIHRQENVDNPQRLDHILAGLEAIGSHWNKEVFLPSLFFFFC